MSNTDPRNPPWNPYEKVELLTEIIKAANVAPDALLHLVRSLPQPQWNDLPLPRGRTVNQAQAVYFQMTQPSAQPSLIRSGSFGGSSRLPDTHSGKRPFPSEGPTSAPPMASRYPDIQPKPVGIGSVMSANSLEEPPKKKRGRPPKAETELRREAARIRGEPYPAQKRPNMAAAAAISATAAAQSSSGPSSAIARAPFQARTPPPPPEQPLPMEVETSSGKKRRARPPRLEADPRRSEEEAAITAPIVTPTRAYPDILSRDPESGPSTFRAPRGGDP